jgi:hypothetical protein
MCGGVGVKLSSSLSEANLLGVFPKKPAKAVEVVKRRAIVVVKFFIMKAALYPF